MVVVANLYVVHLFNPHCFQLQLLNVVSCWLLHMCHCCDVCTAVLSVV